MLPAQALRMVGLTDIQAWNILYDSFYSTGLHAKIRLFSMGMTAAALSGLVLLMPVRHEQSNGAA
jgi:hypothetical protein